MINVRFANINDQEKWDNYVYNNQKASPYHLFAWNISIQGAYGHKIFNLIAEENDNIKGILPLTYINPPLLPGTLYSLPFCDIGGILSDNETTSNKLFDSALDISKSLGNVDLSIRKRETSNYNVIDFNTSEYTDKKVSMLLKLPSSSNTLWDSFKSKLRSQIKKAEKNGLQFQYGNKITHVDYFFDVFSRNMKKLGSPCHSYMWFAELNKNYGNNMTIGIVTKDGKAVGAGILLFVDKCAAIPWASTLSDYNPLAPNMLLYWNLLKIACDRGCNIFDFGRSTYGEGTFRFKEQWGAVPVQLSWKTFSANGNLKLTRNMNSLQIRAYAEKVWRILPVNITNRIGPFTRKYISL